jgi:hypothetical protein
VLKKAIQQYYLLDTQESINKDSLSIGYER